MTDRSTGPDPAEPPVAQVTAHAPVRVADVGGWTDTWFARRGAVCHLGVGPGVRVHASLGAGPPGDRPVRLVLDDLGDELRCGPSDTAGWDEPVPGRHPLLEHAVGSVCRRYEPAGPVTVTITSAVPPGASLGTSAAVTVALIAALQHLLDPATRGRATGGLDDTSRQRIAAAAHRVETAAAGRESGVQDQIAAAFGGAQLVEITDYPTTRRTPVPLDDAFTARIATHTVTVVLGAHDSSAVHDSVIRALTESGGSGAHQRDTLDELAKLAHDAARALGAADLAGWATVCTGATEAQRCLHDDLVGSGHRVVIARARAAGALGWKVNGAGGDGGSVTVVFDDPAQLADFAGAVTDGHPGWSVHHLTPTGGVRIDVDRP